MNEQFSQGMRAYSAWKAQMSRHIKAYQQWLSEHGLNNPEEDLQLFDIIDGLKSDKLTIAFVAEFSRGKTELINSIFFADYKRRLLPSSAGRTTMCTTELFYDNEADCVYMRLLSIETRAEDTTIAEYKDDPNCWTSFDLDIDNPKKMKETFQELARVQTVSVEKAKQLGLYIEDSYAGQPEQIEIPMWRHALISFPHPLLQQGLVILDTPGLNSLGNEPELTMEMIPKAQAVTFIIAADTGVTKTDLDIWRHHIIPHIDPQQTGVIVALNKIDMLWDELTDADKVIRNIAEQCYSSAKLLEIGNDKIFPVSAQKGLLAKIKNNPELLKKSGITKLETFLSEHILPAKQRIVRANMVGKISGRIESTKGLLIERRNAARRQLQELRSLSGKNTDVILQLMNRARDGQVVYKKNVENFQTSRHVLTQQIKTVLEALSIEALDRIIAKTRADMVDSWTTMGLKGGMETFFEGVRHTMEQVSWQTDKSNDLVQAVYQRFRDEHDLKDIDPILFSIKKYRAQLIRLGRDADVFRNSPLTTLTEQSFVVKKFFVSLVSHARNIFFQARQEAEAWARTVMNPLALRIKERKNQLDQHLDSLRKIKSSREKLDEKIQELVKICKDLEQQVETIHQLLKDINTPLPSATEEKISSADAQVIVV